MKSVKMGVLSATLSFLLVGCAAQGTTDTISDIFESTTESTYATKVPTEPAAELLSASGTLPVLYITSKENPDSLDFVTLPIASHVAEDIASWTPGYDMPPAPYYEPCTIMLTDTEGETLLIADADVKVRGNWTTTYDKKPLRLKFTEKQNLLGMNDGASMRNWLLLAEYKDASMLRNKTILTIADALLAEDELYASDAEFVEVIVNGEYWGLYLLAEQQQVNPHRVNVTEATIENTGTDIGYFLEYDGYYTEEAELQSFYVDYADNAPLIPFAGDEVSDKSICPLNEGDGDPKRDTGITIKSDIYSQEQRDFIASYINNVYRILYAAAYEDKAYCFSEDYSAIIESAEMTPQQAVEAVVHIESLADAYILNEVACDADIYWSSFFMSVDFGEGGDGRVRFEAPWDFDSALGNKNRCADGEGFYAANIVPDVNDQYEAINPWLAVLMHEEWFQNVIRTQWTKAYDSGIFERACTMIDSDAKRYADAFACNEKRWDSLQGNTAKSEWSRAVRRCGTHAEMAEHLREWLEIRIAFLNSYWHESQGTDS